MNMFNNMNKSYIYVQFENMVSTDINIRYNEVLKIMKYLYREDYYQSHESMFKKRLKCVFDKDFSATDYRMNRIHSPTSGPTLLNESYAYQLLGSDIICKIWQDLEPYASSFGYHIWNNVSCQ